MNGVLELNLAEDLIARRSAVDRALHVDHVSKYLRRSDRVSTAPERSRPSGSARSTTSRSP